MKIPLFSDRESIEVIKLHMYYCVIHSDDSRKKISLCKLQELSANAGYDISKTMADDFERWINIGQNNFINDNPMYKRDLVFIKKDIPYSSFKNYSSAVAAVGKLLHSKCRVRSEVMGDIH
ncbi:MAG: hypothetical protein LBG82_07310 [Clostridiales Family XIII bacterium]|nr:hypothetical protein [Clostridiales Family XIII bacterium]